jgi:hypothetical protein
MPHAGGFSEYLRYDGLGLADLVRRTVTLSCEVMSKRLLDFIPFTWLHNVTGLPAGGATGESSPLAGEDSRNGALMQADPGGRPRKFNIFSEGDIAWARRSLGGC